MTNLKNKNILYVTHVYKDWIKDPIELMAKEFNHVYVLVWHKPIADILDMFSSDLLIKLENLIFKESHKIYTKKYKFDIKGLPENVTVLPVNPFYLPISFWRDRIGEQHYKQVEKVIKENNIKFDIVHSHIIWSAGYVGMKLKEKYNVPLIVTGHGRDVYKRPYESKLRMSNTKKILQSADRVLTVSNFMAKEIKNISDKDAQVIPNGFVSSKFSILDKVLCRKELGLNISDKMVVSVGHIEPIKGYKYLVEASREIITKCPNLKVILIGNGPDKLVLEELVDSYGLKDNYIFTGNVPNDRISTYLNAADLFVLPSLGEGNPTVMFESLACGLPFIGTRVGGIPEIINDNCGIVIEPKDVKGLSEALLEGLNRNWDKEIIRTYAMQFEWSNITKRILEVYKNLD